MRQKNFGFLALVLMAALSSLLLLSCKGKVSDSDLQKAVNEKIAANNGMSGVSATVSEGVVTLAGQCTDEASKSSTVADIKTIEGVKDVVNNVTVTPAAAPVVITPDDPLKQSVNAALSNYSGITADVNEGVVTLKGNIKRADLQRLMMTMNALKPKKINNELTIK